MAEARARNNSRAGRAFGFGEIPETDQLHGQLTLVKIVAGGIALLGVGLMIDRKTSDAEQSAREGTKA